MKPYRDALVEDGIPLAQFAVDDVEAEHARLIGKGVVFTQPPTDIGTAVVAVFDDTCGNLIQLIEEKPAEKLGRRPVKESDLRCSPDRPPNGQAADVVAKPDGKHWRWWRLATQR